MPCFNGTDGEEDFEILSLATTESSLPVLHHRGTSDEQVIKLQSSNIMKLHLVWAKDEDQGLKLASDTEKRRNVKDGWRGGITPPYEA